MTTTPEQIEAALSAFALASGLGIFPNDEKDEEWREDLVNGMRAAIDTMRPFIRAEVLEEAAKVADGYHRTKEVTRDLMDDGNITTTTVRSLADPLKIASAIRALKEKKNG